MATQIELAQLAAAAYRNASDFNRILAPAGWQVVLEYPEGGQTTGDGSGFSAAAYRGPGGEIVIAYTGTNDWKDWPAANAPAAVGFPSPQVVQAARFYWQVLNGAAGGDRARISFTGHSLGGGLASLMAVYFDRPATVFQTAPFEASAFGAVLGQYAVAFAAAGIDDAAWRQYLAARNDGTLSAVFATRERQVAHVYVSGEVLAPTRTGATAILNPALETALASGAALANGSTPRQLHSMLLAWSMLANPEFGAQMRRLPRLYGLLRDARLFDRPAETEDNDLHALLMQREAATGMLTRFTNDVRRIADGFADKTPVIADALIAATMAFYYARRFGIAGDTGEATAAVPGGLQLALTELAQAGSGGERARAMLEDVVDLLSGNEGQYRAVQGKDRLTISDGGGLRFTDTQARNDLVIGLTGDDEIDGGGGDDTIVTGGGADRLSGGDGFDVLDAGAGDDTLAGGAGADRLLGGLGHDTYEFTGAFGHDTVIDADGAGAIRIDGQALPAGLRVSDNLWMSADRRYTFVFTPSAADPSRGTLVIQQAGSDKRITVRDWQRGTLGVVLTDTPLPQTPPVATTRTIVGDRAPLDTDASQPGVQYGYDELGNLLTTNTVEVRADTLYDSAEADFIDAGGGADSVRAIRGGDDTIEAGAGHDWVDAGPGNDVVNGGADRDVLFGNDGDDTVDGGEDEDRVNGMAGDDLLRGGAGSDLTGGGAGRDVIYAGGGDDVVVAGGDVQPSALDAPPGAVLLARGQDWGVHVVRDANGRNVTYYFNWAETDNDTDDDIAYGEAGNDLLLGGRGNDLLDGGADDDDLIGEEGSDTLAGGTGNDRLWGDGSRPYGSGDDWSVAPQEVGDDLLDGGDGDDYLVGDGGADTLLGGRGADTLVGDRVGAGALATPHGSDYLEGGAGDDTLAGGGAADLLYGDDGNDILLGDWVNAAIDGNAVRLDLTQEGDDLLDGGAGRDTLIGGGGHDVLQGGEGDDVLYGDLGGYVPADGEPIPEGNDVLEGGAGNDTIFGEGGDDTLIGGAGDDYLQGGAGDDVYVYNAGDGADTIVDTEGDNEVVFGAGVDASALAVSVSTSAAGDNVVQLALSTGHSLRLQGGLSGATAVAFADGTRLTGAELLQRSTSGIDYQGRETNDRIFGTAGGDRLDGGRGDDLIVGQQGGDELIGQAGNDTLEGGDGDDVLDGGIGRDLLQGGAGSDTYRLGLGSGFDEIRDDGGTLQFGPEVRLSDLRVVRRGADLEVVWSNVDRATIRNYEFAADAWRVRLANGQELAVGDLPSVSAAPPIANFAQAKEEFLRELRRQWLAQQIASGLIPNADGTLGGTRTYRSDGVTVIDRITASFTENLVESDASRITAPATTTTTSRTATFSNVITTTTYVAVQTTVPVTIRLPASPGPRSAPDPTEGGRQQTITIGYTTSVSYVPRTVRVGREEYAVNSNTAVGVLTAGAAGNVIEVHRTAIVDAGAGDDVIDGRLSSTWPFSGALLFGNAGNDRIEGTPGDDWIAGGTGDDTLRGGRGADRYLRFAGDGRDLIVDEDWRDYGLLGPVEGWPHATVEQIRALLDAAPGEDDVLVLPGGVRPADLRLSWSTRTLRTAVQDTALRQDGMWRWERIDPITSALVAAYEVAVPVLTVRWSDTEAVDIVFPTRQMPRAWGIEYVEFADGTRLSRDELFALAPPFDRETIDADNELVGVTRGYGGDGDDRLVGTPGDDFLVGGSGDDVLEGGAGNDVLYGGKGADLLEGGDGNDVLGDLHDRWGSSQSGADEFYGAGNTYRGGRGNDLIHGTWDADVYEFRLGDGRDTVVHVPRRLPPETYANWLEIVGAGFRDYALGDLPPEIRARVESGYPWRDIPLKSLDTLRFAAGISSADVSVRRDGNDLLVEHRNGTDSVRFLAWFGPSSFGSFGFGEMYQPLGRIEFADGTVWSVAADGSVSVESTGNAQPSDGDDRLLGSDGADRIDALAGNDRIEAGAGDDVLQGNAGDDVLALGGGADAVILNRGDGADTVLAANAGGGAGERNDTLLIGAASIGEIRLAREGDDLVVKIAGTSDSVRLAGWYAHPDNRTFVSLIVDGNPFAAATAPGTATTPAYDFARIVEGFDRAYAANPALGDWPIERRYLMPPPEQPPTPIEPLNAAATLAADAATIAAQSASEPVSTSERVRLLRPPARWVAEVVGAGDTGVKVPLEARVLGAEEPGLQTSIAVCVPEGSRPPVAGAPHRSTGGMAEDAAMDDAFARVTIPRRPTVRPVTAAMVEAALTKLDRGSGSESSLRADAGELRVIAREYGQMPFAATDLAPAASDARIRETWRRIEAYLRAQRDEGMAPVLGGEDEGALRPLARGDWSAAVLAADRPHRLPRAGHYALAA
jgi:Ca2+-binding RTX toxin-like protein